jgi:hypothetical protein
LNWDESNAADFDYFTVYGSNTSTFASSTVIDYTVSPTLNVNTSPYAFYFVTATDFSGNEGRPATANAATSVDEISTRYELSVSSYPNPFNVNTTVKYTVPVHGRVTVGVYDARGRQVATLVEEDKVAGAYTVSWDGRDGRGHGVGSGVYFARVSHGDRTLSYKMLLK